MAAVSGWPKTFRQAFCERYRCSEAQYVRKAFRKCLYRRVVLFAPLLETVWHDFFQVDLDAIERVGTTQNWKELHTELRAFLTNSDLRSRLLRSQFRLRVSGNRICHLAEVLFGPATPSSGGK